MSNGGMIQILKEDGSWSDCFPVSYRTHEAAMNVANKYKTSTRIVNRKGAVLYKIDIGDR